MPRRRPHPRSGAAGMRTPPERLQSAMARPAGARGETDLPPPKLPRAGLRSLEASKFEECGTMQVGLPQVRSISRLEIGKKKQKKNKKNKVTRMLRSAPSAPASETPGLGCLCGSPSGSHPATLRQFRFRGDPPRSAARKLAAGLLQPRLLGGGKALSSSQLAACSVQLAQGKSCGMFVKVLRLKRPLVSEPRHLGVTP